MPNESSFDIGFTPEIAEIENALNQALKELSQRFDFKGTRTTIELDKKTLTFILQTIDELKLKNLREILERRLAGRGIPPAAQTVTPPEPAAGGTVRQSFKIQKGLPEDKIPRITAAVKEVGVKARAQVQGAEIRVFGRSRDDLQAVITALKAADFGCALKFGNYR
jgi:hypothetical protein